MEWRLRKIELYVGFFIGSGLIILIALFLIQGASKELFADHVKITTFATRSFGLHEGSPVKMLDISVGNVKSVELTEEGKIKIDIRVRKDYSRFIRQNVTTPDTERGSFVTLSSTGLDILGPALLITHGDLTLPQVQGDALLPFKEKSSPLDDTLKNVKKLMDSITSEKNSIGRMLNDKGELFDILKQILTGINATLKKSEELTGKSTGLVEKLTTLIERLDKTLEKMSSPTSSLGAFLNDKSFFETFSSAIGKLNSILGETRGAMDLFKKILSDFTGASSLVPELTSKLDGLLMNTKEITDALKKNFFIAPFIAKPPKQELMEIMPR